MLSRRAAQEIILNANLWMTCVFVHFYRITQDNTIKQIDHSTLKYIVDLILAKLNSRFFSFPNREIFQRFLKYIYFKNLRRQIFKSLFYIVCLRQELFNISNLYMHNEQCKQYCCETCDIAAFGHHGKFGCDAYREAYYTTRP